MSFDKYKNNLMDQHKDNLIRKHKGNLCEKYKGNVMDQHKGNIVDHQKGNVMDQHKDNIVDKYKNNVMDNHSYVIKINTNLPNDNYWIRLRRNNQYIPYKIQSNHKSINPKSINHTSINHGDINDDWKTVESKKKEKEKLIYYWVVDSHNLFDRREKSYRLFFTEPDSTQIENMDQTNYMAMTENGQLRLLHSQLKHNGMKMNPTFYIARNIKQIQEALKYVKYCVVKIDNNEQKLMENPVNLQITKFHKSN